MNLLPANTEPSHLSLRGLTWSIVRQAEKQLETDEQLLAQLNQGHPELQRTISLARNFAAIIRQRQAEKLDGWLQEASESGYQLWSSFAVGLAQDHAAARLVERAN